MDKLNEERRSQNMRQIRSKDTNPEMVLRRMLHRAGYRFRLHRKDLPGKPDIVFPARRAVIFIHGCFWHQHPNPDCKDARQPKSNLTYWRPKLEKNQTRDADHAAKLEAQGWRVLIVWECETKNTKEITQRIQRFLS